MQCHILGIIFHRLARKKTFHHENFHGLLTSAPIIHHVYKYFVEKTFVIYRHKREKFTKVFSVESFPLYGTKSWLKKTLINYHGKTLVQPLGVGSCGRSLSIAGGRPEKLSEPRK